MNLEPLAYEDAACAIQDTFTAYDFASDQRERGRWVERLAELCKGWPQHINSVSVAASSIIRDNDYRIDAGRLAAGSASQADRIRIAMCKLTRILHEPSDGARG